MASSGEVSAVDAAGGQSLEQSSASLRLKSGAGKEFAVDTKLCKKVRNPFTEEELLEAEKLFSKGWQLAPKLRRVLQDLRRRCEANRIRWELIVAGILQNQSIHTNNEFVLNRLRVAVTSKNTSRWALLVPKMIENQLVLCRFELAEKRVALSLFKERETRWNRMACSSCFGRWLMDHFNQSDQF